MPSKKRREILARNLRRYIKMVKIKRTSISWRCDNGKISKWYQVYK